MKNLPSQGFSELEVKNFGPIVEAKIDLRPLTVLVGPSNTGKSYLAILLYALHRFLSGEACPGTLFSPLVTYFNAAENGSCPEENLMLFRNGRRKRLARWSCRGAILRSTPSQT